MASVKKRSDLLESAFAASQTILADGTRSARAPTTP
jgi:hypothetical protein